MNRTGFSMAEVLVVIAITAILTAIGIAAMPKDQDVTLDGLPDRFMSALQSAHSQAMAERTTVTLTGAARDLTVTTADGTEHVSFAPAQTGGTITIQPSGSTTGTVTLTLPSGTCSRYSLTLYGTSAAGMC
ncbi:hypothetical protein CBQ26_16960 [Deinococcus indicus]|uniref:Prepilin-type N-terminal cleavage/methylation domain-containing protein n=1 Tax=Deinococcus indicus TaxID=223556 RepID=A0A246BG43_9DEIO|nr:MULTISPECIES: prepilin-type N-terminal cleavage/methylation domain-containing protein [Deinococcus]MCD0159909.1 prepilin-type N-terminal cleavage/methylation domain-containing protein [Deinococcus sp. 6YEL10]OWL94187.1 hypothetical protein CBQ26_16960 [Deinococcus indicus]